MTFTQNYVWVGVGYAYPASWSLAVEEHFYFALALFLWIGLKKNELRLKLANNYSGLSQIEITILIIMALCLFFRVITNIMFPLLWPKNFTMTHLRIDSLLAGVFVSYLYYFRIDHLQRIFI